MAAKRSCIGVRAIGLSVLAVMSLSLPAGCGAPRASVTPAVWTLDAPAVSPAEEQAQALMAKYGLHPVGRPSSSYEVTLTPDGQDEIGVDWIRLSKRVGLDPSAYVGQKVTEVSYALWEHNQADGPVFAVFLVKNRQVIAAQLDLAGYKGGRGDALMDHEELAPPGWDRDDLDLSTVKEVLLWVKDGPATPKQSKKLLGFIAASKRQSGDRFGVSGDNEYRVWLVWANGATVQCHLIEPASGAATFLVIDTRNRPSYVPAPGMKAYMDKLYASGEIGAFR